MPRRTTRTILHTDLMRWEPLVVNGSDGYAWIKTLSKDAETGARSALVKHDPGFRAPAATAEWSMDMYVLQGEMVAGDRRYEPSTFHYRPKGTKVGPLYSATGITRIVFTVDSQDPKRSSSDEVFIQSVDRDVPWNRVLRDKHAGDATRDGSDESTVQFMSARKQQNDCQFEASMLRRNKTLRIDEKMGLRMRLYSVKRGGLRNMLGEIHIHPYFEETFLIKGTFSEYLEEVDGHMKWVPGSYLCRPAGECRHGDTLKQDDDDHLSITRNGWTTDPAKAEQWRTTEANTTIPIGPIAFNE